MEQTDHWPGRGATDSSYWSVSNRTDWIEFFEQRNSFDFFKNQFLRAFATVNFENY